MGVLAHTKYLVKGRYTFSDSTPQMENKIERIMKFIFLYSAPFKFSCLYVFLLFILYLCVIQTLNPTFESNLKILALKLFKW